MVGRRHQPKPGDAARRVMIARADKRSADLRPTIEALQASGVTSLRGHGCGAQRGRYPYPAREEAVESSAGSAIAGAVVNRSSSSALNGFAPHISLP
jgi:hypothetical protein